MPEFTPARLKQIRSHDIRDIGLGPAAQQSLRLAGINTLGDLERCAAQGIYYVEAKVILSDLKHIGPAKIEIIRRMLHMYGLTFRDEVNLSRP